MKNVIDSDDDFGFSAVSLEEYESKIQNAAKEAASSAEVTAKQYQDKLQKVEAMILPFLEKLRDTGDKEYIFWPNRKPAINKQIEKLLKLTRG